MLLFPAEVDKEAQNFKPPVQKPHSRQVIEIHTPTQQVGPAELTVRNSGLRGSKSELQSNSYVHSQDDIW